MQKRQVLYAKQFPTANGHDDHEREYFDFPKVLLQKMHEYSSLKVSE